MVATPKFGLLTIRLHSARRKREISASSKGQVRSEEPKKDKHEHTLGKWISESEIIFSFLPPSPASTFVYFVLQLLSLSFLSSALLKHLQRHRNIKMSHSNCHTVFKSHFYWVNGWVNFLSGFHCYWRT